MRVETAVRRALPLAGTALVLAVGLWQLIGASLPLLVAVAEIGLVLLAAAVACVSLHLRLTERTGDDLLALGHGLFSVSLATAILALAAPWLHQPVPLITLAYIAVLVSLNPRARAPVLGAIQLATLGGLSLVWWRAGLLATGAGNLLTVQGLLVGVSVLAYSNWSLTDRRSVAHSLRLRAVADSARRLGAARTLDEIARAALGGCRDAYPDATWGGIMLLDHETGALAGLPAYLGPDGLESSPGPAELNLQRGEGVTGRVAATGRPCLLRTRREVATAYHEGLDPSRLRDVERWGGGRGARSFLAVPLRSPDGRTLGVLVLNSHVREQVWDLDDLTTVQGIADEAAVAIERARLLEEQMRHASTDPLTRVANRRAFEERLRAQPEGPFAVLAIDVDHLKELNDEYGHEAGDRLLVEVARVLRAHVRATDLVARIGGDEFVAVLTMVTLDEARAVAERMRTSLHGVALPHGHARISIGLAGASRDSDLRSLWLAADHALAAAKRSGRDRVTLARDGGGPAVALRRDAARLLEDVLNGDSAVRSAFQRIADLRDLSTTGYEALARFPRSRSRDSGVDDVFDLAQRRGALRDLDWVCRRAALAGAAALPPHLPLFVNVSSAMLLDPLHPVDHMLLLARSTGRDASDLVLEISEREAIADKRRLRLVLSSYREHGFRFALDDVGEGHSTLELLAVAVPEYIKIARSITQRCDQRGPRAVVEAAAAFAESVGARVIAEGIEDAEAAERMLALGATHGQGFWLGRPAEFPAELTPEQASA